MDLFQSTEFQNHAEDLMKEWHTLGLAIAVVQNEQTASRGYGLACLNPERPVTGDTIFNVASCAKSLTAASVALVVEDNQKNPQVQWAAVVSELLPDDFAMAEESYTKTVTVEDILSHRSGLPRHDMSKFGPRSEEHADSTRSITRNIRNLPIVAPVRSRCIYNNLLYTVAAYLVERHNGLPFEEVLRQRIFKPLGMTSTFLGSNKAIEAGYEEATGYPHYWDKTTSSYHRVELEDAPESAGAGMIASSANDYARWVKALMNQEPPIGERILHDITTPRSIFMYEDEAKFSPYTSATLYGLGLMVEWYRGHRIVFHTGGMPGVASRFFFLPEHKFGGVMIGNTPGAHNVISVLTHELIDEALGVPENERVDWNQLQHAQKKDDMDKKETKKGQRRERLLSRRQSFDLPLEACAGDYHNVGYGPVKVELRDDSLFIDATGRTFGFTLDRFEECGGSGSYVAHGWDFLDAGEPREMAVQFYRDDDWVIAMGMDIEPEMEDYIRFERVSLGDKLTSE